MESLVRVTGSQVSFKFSLNGEGGKVSNILIKECGVQLLFDTEDLRRPLRELYSELGAEYDGEFASQVRLELGLDSQSQRREALITAETSDERECNDKNNQEGGAWLRHCFHVGLCLGTFLFAAVAVAKTRGLR
ncbi:hypothetical protein RIF29_21514 [Crotalaria pallida]|uniref:Uncharacterized protein n=1 Tax=Crotalaria pallida TaxID=3830 RepID=A0AAN9F5G0_CROPI